MRILNRQLVDEFKKKHSKSRSSLDNWINTVSAANWASNIDVVATYRKAEEIDGIWIFNISDGVRLAATVTFEVKTVVVESLMSHAEYERGKWKK
jgi:mRNA interferase HigB